jgi:hypothetical protein
MTVNLVDSNVLLVVGRSQRAHLRRKRFAYSGVLSFSLHSSANRCNNVGHFTIWLDTFLSLCQIYFYLMK